MKKNVKIAKSLLKLAKELVAINQFEKAVQDDKSLAVYQGTCQDMIESIRLFSQVRIAFDQQSADMQQALDAFTKNRENLGYSSKQIQTFIGNLRSESQLNPSAQYMLSKNEQAKKYPNMIQASQDLNDRITAVEAIIMPELQAFQNAVQLSNLSKELCNISNLPKILGIDTEMYKMLTQGVIPEFDKVMKPLGIDYLIQKSKQSSFKNTHQMFLDEYDRKLLEGEALRIRLSQYLRLWGISEKDAVNLNNYLLENGAFTPEQITEISDDDLKKVVNKELQKLQNELGSETDPGRISELMAQINYGQKLLKSISNSLTEASRNMKLAIVSLKEQNDKYLAPTISYTNMMTARMIPNVMVSRKDNGEEEIPLPSKKASVKTAGWFSEFFDKVVDWTKRVVNKIGEFIDSLKSDSDEAIKNANDASETLNAMIQKIKQ